VGSIWYFPAEFPTDAGRRVFFAAAAHLAAHARFGGPPFARGSLKGIPIVLVSLLEDARVEHLASRELPGLASLWRGLHSASPFDLPTFPALAARIARALADPAYRDPHPLVTKARAFFATWDDAPTRDACRAFGSTLGNDIGQMRLPFNERTYAVEPCYRDDHRLLWEPESDEPRDLDDRGATEPHGGGGGAGDVANVAATIARYHEWDYQIRRARPAFCTVREVSTRGLAAASPRTPAPRLARLALKIQASRRRKRLDGESLDLDATIEARVDQRRGSSVDGRLYVRTDARSPDTSVLLLLDTSASTADAIPGSRRRVIDVIRDSARVLALSLASGGKPVAVHGFCSNGRHDVIYRRLKNFDEPWDHETDARLDALAPGLSTRMGAAMRHAARSFAPTRRERRLLVLLTDGEPSDIDAPDPAYLTHDAAQAVREIRRQGIYVFGIHVDPSARVRRIFGDGRFRVVDRIERLPEILVALFGRLAK
jgi:Mg-chelatase subunit ChlD